MGEHRRSDDWFSHILEPAPQDVSLTVQMYGAVLILQASSSSSEDVQISHVSDNFLEVSGIPIDQALHKPLHDICLPSFWTGLVEEAQRKSMERSDDIYTYAKVPLASGVELWMVVHASGPTLVCELLPVVDDALNDPNWVQVKLAQLKQLLSIPKDSIFRSAQTATSFINDVLQFDRCVLYRFGSSASFGEIIAETFTDGNPHGLVPFLGLRFPAQALTDEVTALYKKLKVRMIAEVFDFISLIISKDRPDQHLATVSVSDLPAAGHADRALDLLIHSVLRAATAGHDEELVSMGVRNCMTAVLIVDGSLWGVLQCANINVRSFSWSHRLFLASAAELLSSFISNTLDNIEQEEGRSLSEHCRHIALVNSERGDRPLIEPLLTGRPNMQEILQRDTGVAYMIGDSLFRVGRCPSASEVECLIRWMVSPDWNDHSDASQPPLPWRQDVMSHLNAISWPANLAEQVRDTLNERWFNDDNVRSCCWDHLPAALLPVLQLTTATDTLNSVLGIISNEASPRGKRIALFFFQPPARDSGKVLQSLSSSILTNSLVSDTVHRYTERGDGQLSQPWTLRQLVVFRLISSLLLGSRRGADVQQHIPKLRTTLLQSVQSQLPGLLILHSNQPQIVLCQTNGVLQCLSINQECARLFGPVVVMKRGLDSTQPFARQVAESASSTDVSSWCQEIGLDVSSILCDGQQIVKQQGVWSKTRGHIKVTLMCRFLYGVRDAYDTEALYCLDVKDDSLSSRVHEALIYAHVQLKKSERMKQDLVGTISHELRTPLSAIIGFHEELCKELGERRDLTTDAQQCLDSISTASEHLFAIVTDLVDLSKREMTTRKRSRVDLITVVHEACVWMANKAAERRVCINFEVSPSSSSAAQSSNPTSLTEARSERRAASATTDAHEGSSALTQPPMSVYGDTVALKRVFVNLLDNAVKFSSIGSVILVSMRWVPSITTGQGGYTNVVIEDSGIGIDTENLTNIFRPFYQVDLSSHRVHQGLGLGLSIVRQIIELHQGRISVRSKLGKGTRFDITLPTYDSQTPQQRERSLKDTVTSPLEATQYPVLGSTSISPPLESRSTSTDMQQYIAPSRSATPQVKPRRLVSSPQPRIDTSTCIMIVDDNSTNRRLLHRMLGNMGYSNIVEAQDGKEAVQTVETLYASSSSMAREQPPVSLMFLDLQMPVMDGPSAVRVLRASGFTFPIIAFSASIYSETSPSRPLFSGYLAKPIDRETLRNILHRHLNPSSSA